METLSIGQTVHYEDQQTESKGTNEQSGSNPRTTILLV